MVHPDAAPSRTHPPLYSLAGEFLIQDLVVTLPQGEAQVVLEREGSRLVHRGTVGVRGPCAPRREELAALGLTAAQARALEFVLDWFAAPFDQLTCEPQGVDGLRWGVWPLSGTALIEGLARWKRRDPHPFEARLGRLGVDATLRQPTGKPSLTLLDAERGHFVEGREALHLLGADLRLLAALAQAGRERGAQLAQLEYLIARVLRPALASPSEQHTAPLDSPGGPFSTPRALALLLHAELRVGRRGVTRLLSYTRGEVGQPLSGEHAGQHFAVDLQAAGRTGEAAEVRRILSSPELVEDLS